MASGSSNKLTGQIGEHLVAAILGTKGFYASPYSGNVPGFDITAVNANTLESFPIQVKTSNGGSIIRTRIEKWVNFSIDKDNRQILGAPLPLDHPDLVWVAVLIKDADIKTSRFFVATEKEIQDVLIRHYQRFLDQHDGKRPRNHKTTQTMLTIDDLIDFEDNWSILENN